MPVEWTRHFSSFSWCLIWLYIRIYNSLIAHQSRVKCLENCNHMLLQVEACIYFRVHIQFTSQTNAILNFSLHLKVLIFSIILYLIYDTQPCFPTQCFRAGNCTSVHLNLKCHTLIVFQVNIIQLMATELHWAPYL